MVKISRVSTNSNPLLPLKKYVCNNVLLLLLFQTLCMYITNSFCICYLPINYTKLPTVNEYLTWPRTIFSELITF